MKKIPIVISDYERILLTEVLPYELPIIFTNEWFYQQAKVGFDNVPPLVRVMLKEKIGRETVPYGYSIRQGFAKKRHLSLIHPAAQLTAVDLYRDSNQQICWLCSRSQYSVRYPAQVASYYFDKAAAAHESGLKQDSVDTDSKSSALKATHAASFFAYRDHSHLYKFIESPAFLSIEARFRLLLRFDVKRCFPSLYTHSINWAVKGKDFAKRHRGASSFEDRFDRIMRDANHGETNGIVIGPELSRIFAEIVLQKVDLDISRKIELRNLSNKVQIKRYIDDYFVFGNEKSDLDAVCEIAQEVLQKFNLFVNESKTVLSEAPFVTKQTIAKHEIKDELNSSILGWFREVGDVCTGKSDAESFSVKAFSENPERYAQILIKRIKVSIRRNDASYEIISGYVLGAVAKALFRLGSQKLSVESRTKTLLCALLSAAIEVCLFVYLMDIRVQTTYRISQIILMAVRISKVDRDFSRNLISRIAQLSYEALKLQGKRDEFGPEILNLLVTTRAIDPDRLLSPDQIHSLLTNTEGNVMHWDYFRSVSIIYYIRDRPEYGQLMESILDAALLRFRTQTPIENDTESLLLLLDVSACPYVSTAWKERIIRAATENILRRSVKAGEFGQMINYCTNRLSFTVWDADVRLERLLKKKELTFTY